MQSEGAKTNRAILDLELYRDDLLVYRHPTRATLFADRAQAIPDGYGADHAAGRDRHGGSIADCRQIL